MAKRFDRHGKRSVLHYVTINARNRCKAFKSPENAIVSCYELRQLCDEYPAKLVAYVIMPDHMHFIVNPQNGNIDEFVKKLKIMITRRVFEIAAAHEKYDILAWLFDETKQRYRLWQDGKYDFYLYTDRIIWQKINYIHTNPIARGIVSTAPEYPYSSYRVMYETGDDIIIPIDREMWWDEIILD